MNVPGSRITGGSDETMLNILAERVFGMPQDFRSDKGIPFSEIPTGSNKLMGVGPLPGKSIRV